MVNLFVSGTLRLPGISKSVLSSLRFTTIVLCLANLGFAQFAVKGYLGAEADLAADGSYSISVPGPVAMLKGSLGVRPANAKISSGTDSLGAYSDLAFDYTVGSSQRSASMRTYAARPVILFSVTFHNAADNTQPFPTFGALPKDLMHLTYSGFFAAPVFSYFANDSPWVYYDNAAKTLILSPASDYMTAQTRLGAGDQVELAISSDIAKLPAGFTHCTAVGYGQGISNTLAAWGSALMALTGKTRPVYNDGPMLRKVSYWTDNGSTYYYNPGPNSYPDTLRSIKQEFSSKGVQLGSMQLDSWWYPKGPDAVWSNHGGIWNYTADPGVIPAGLKALRFGVGVPLITHARWIDAGSPLRRQYTVSGNVSTDPRYWEDVGDYLQASGVTTFEQDWLGNNAQAAFNLNDPNAFLDNMADSMAKRGITMIYCMANPSHFMQSTKYQNVTAIRSGQDGFVPAVWDDFLYSSRFAASLGMWPFSDVFMSTQRDNLLLATLSAGPLGVGDPLGTLSGKNLLRSTRADGVIVKPDFPITPMDSVYLADAKGKDAPMIASTYSDFTGGRAQYIFAYARGAANVVTIRPADFGITGSAWLQDDLGGTGTLIHDGSSTQVTLHGVGYFVLVPVGKSGMAFLGDKDQFVTMGHARIADFSDTGVIATSVRFAEGESVRTLFGYSPRGISATVAGQNASEVSWNAATQLFSVTVRATAAGTVKVQISNGVSTPSPAPTSSVTLLN